MIHHSCTPSGTAGPVALRAIPATVPGAGLSTCKYIDLWGQTADKQMTNKPENQQNNKPTDQETNKPRKPQTNTTTDNTSGQRIPNQTEMNPKSTKKSLKNKQTAENSVLDAILGAC